MQPWDLGYYFESGESMAGLEQGFITHISLPPVQGHLPISGLLAAWHGTLRLRRRCQEYRDHAAALGALTISWRSGAKASPGPCHHATDAGRKLCEPRTCGARRGGRSQTLSTSKVAAGLSISLGAATSGC